jgi:hypothetical protein
MNNFFFFFYISPFLFDLNFMRKYSHLQFNHLLNKISFSLGAKIFYFKDY